MEVEKVSKKVSNKVEAFDWIPTKSTSKTQLRKRRSYLNTSKWCPKPGCHEMCVKKVGGRKRYVGAHSISKFRKNSPYPDCDEYGVVTRAEVQLWNTKFRVSRQIAAVDKLLGPKKSK